MTNIFESNPLYVTGECLGVQIALILGHNLNTIISFHSTTAKMP